jgi:hypothetical protein
LRYEYAVETLKDKVQDPVGIIDEMVREPIVEDKGHGNSNLIRNFKHKYRSVECSFLSC